MKKTMKDIAMFSMGSIALGGLSSAVGKAGGDTHGLSAMSEFMPTIGSLTMMGNTVRMTKKLLPKKKRGGW